MKSLDFTTRLILLFLCLFMFSGASSMRARAMPLVAGKVTEYRLPQGHNPWGSIASGPDGNLWFLEYPGNHVGKMTTQGNYTEYTIPTYDSRPVGIAAGPDGNLWFTENVGGAIGRMTPKGKLTNYSFSGTSSPDGITVGPDTNLWFVAPGDDAIGMITWN